LAHSLLSSRSLHDALPILGSVVRVWQYLFRGLLCIVDVNVFDAGLVIGISIAWLMRSSTEPVLNIVFAWHLIGEGTIFQIIDQLLRHCSNGDCLTLGATLVGNGCLFFELTINVVHCPIITSLISFTCVDNF